jgi:hypothetical protein
VNISIILDAFAPHPVNCGFAFGVYAADQLTVGIDQSLLDLYCKTRGVHFLRFVEDFYLTAIIHWSHHDYLDRSQS